MARKSRFSRHRFIRILRVRLPGLLLLVLSLWGFLNAPNPHRFGVHVARRGWTTPQAADAAHMQKLVWLACLAGAVGGLVLLVDARRIVHEMGQHPRRKTRDKEPRSRSARRAFRRSLRPRLLGLLLLLVSVFGVALAPDPQEYGTKTRRGWTTRAAADAASMQKLVWLACLLGSLGGFLVIIDARKVAREMRGWSHGER